MNRRLVLAVILVAIALIIGAAYLGVRGGRAEGDDAPEAPITVGVSRGRVQQTVVAPGQVVGTREVVLSMDVGGRLATISVRPGSEVNACDVLAQLEVEPLVQALEETRSALARQLQEGMGPISTGELERAEANLEAASLTAPFDGVVLEVMARPGETIAPGMGLILLADPTAIEVRTTVIEEDLPLVQIGQPAELFFDAQPDAIVEGWVARIVPQRVRGENRPLYYVYISMDEAPEGVVSGMTADASITISRRSDVLRLPRALVRARSNGTAQVTVWANEQEESRKVQVGLRGDVYIEILDGLREGEQVVGQ